MRAAQRIDAEERGASTEKATVGMGRLASGCTDLRRDARLPEFSYSEAIQGDPVASPWPSASMSPW